MVLMGKYSGKGCAGEQMASRKGNNIAFGDPANQNDQYCNRIGCSGRVKYNQSTKVGSSGKIKPSLPSLVHSSKRNEITRTNPVITRSKSSFLNSKRKSESEIEASESSNLDQPLATPVVPPIRSYRSVSMKKSGKITAQEVGSSSSILSDPSKRSVPKSSAIGATSSANGSRYGLRNLRCGSISDVVRPNSSPNSKSVSKNVVRGENSSSVRIRKTSAATLTSSVSTISDARSSGTSFASGPRRPTNMNIRNSLQSVRDGSTIISRVPNNRLPMSISSSSSRRFPENGSSDSFSLSSNSRSTTTGGDRTSRTLPFTSGESGFPQLFNRDVLQRYNIDGIAEMLLALERIEQSHDLTNEQLLALESSLYVGGINMYDQHRDMRLDIDNMSYEELLALEEKMGTVSTALSEEALSNCVKRGTYLGSLSKLRIQESDENENDTKCSICQEDYEIGDGMGKLVECKHEYHETCINQWLRLKNWCPVCKSSATPSSSK